MKRFLLLLGVAALLVAAPAFAQYVYLDVDGNGVCNSLDVLNNTITSVDVYFDTNHNGDGTPATCSDGVSQLTINSYEFILSASGTGSVTYGAYTNNQSATMTTQVGPEGAGGNTDYHIGFGGATANPPGLYKVGSLAITVTGTPVLAVHASTSLIGTALTSFGSQCPGGDFDNTMKLGPNPLGATDFTSVCGTAPGTPVKVTTWGAIKNLYK